MQVSAFLSLTGALVQSGSSPGVPRGDPRQPGSSSSMPLELLRAMREAGAVKALARVLTFVNMSHAKVGARYLLSLIQCAYMCLLRVTVWCMQTCPPASIMPTAAVTNVI